jgi:hypothetical protein
MMQQLTKDILFNTTKPVGDKAASAAAAMDTSG